MIVIIFKEEPGAHNLFKNWREVNEKGFVINERSKTDAMLHRANGCMHLGDETWFEGKKNWGSMGNSTKVCSTHREQLIEWAKDYYDAELKFCKHCNP